MTLITHAARVLADARGESWELLDPEEQGRLRGAVWSVIRALRDPDERMEQAGAEIIRNVSPDESGEAYRNDAANTWRLMIDALASEEK